MRLLLIRHGQTPSNVKGLLDSEAPGPVLTELGERQAAAIPEALTGQPIDGIAVSNLVRTHLTAAPLAEELGLTPLEFEGLREVRSGDLEMASDRESFITYLTAAMAWGAGDLEPRIPGSENGYEFFARFDDALRQVAAQRWETAAVVSHGAAIRVWVSGRAEGADRDLIADTPLANTGLIEVEGDPDSGWRFVAWVDGPLGGAHLDSRFGTDPVGESLEEVVD